MSRTHLSRRELLLIAVIAALLIGLAAVVIPHWLTPPQQRSPQALTPTASVTQPPTPSASPSRSSQPLTGGDLGKRVPFQSGDGTGWLSISAAEWTDSGQAAPPAGSRYLVVTLNVECSQGELVIDSHWLRAKSGADWTGPGFGPSLTDPLTHHLLRAGEKLTGQVGFVLTPGAATVGLLDENLSSVAELGLTAP